MLKVSDELVLCMKTTFALFEQPVVDIYTIGIVRWLL